MIGCYAVTPAVHAGGEALIQGSTSAKTCCLELVRLTSSGPRLLCRSAPHRGCYVRAGLRSSGRWRAMSVTVTATAPAVDIPDGSDHCPADFTLLAYAELRTRSATGWRLEEREQADDAPRVAAIGYLRRGSSLVFNAGTTDWAIHLAEPPVDKLTRNVLSALERT